jgi:hypothetical protein
MQSGIISNSKKNPHRAIISETCKLAIFRNPKKILFWAQFFEIGKMSTSGNFSISEKFFLSVIFPTVLAILQNPKIASLGNLSKLETCPHKKIVPNLTNFLIDHFFQQYALTS